MTRALTRCIEGAGQHGVSEYREHAELTDTPRFCLTEAQHGESGRVMEAWSDRWASEILHACGKQVTGLE